MLSACWLIGAYFLAVSDHKCGHLNTSVYGMCLQNLPAVDKHCVMNILNKLPPKTTSDQNPGFLPGVGEALLWWTAWVLVMFIYHSY